MVRSLRSTGVSGPKDPESPASSFFSALCIFVVRYWIGARSQAGHISRFPNPIPGLPDPEPELPDPENPDYVLGNVF